MSAERVIFKYRIRLPGDTVSHDIDPNGEVVHVGLDPQGVRCVWVDVDPDAPRESRLFVIVGTGTPLPAGGWPVGSFVDLPFVWHVIEVPS